MINKNALKLSNITEEEYKKWCKDNNKYFSKPATKKEFFLKIQSGKIVRDKDGKIINKPRRQNDGN